MNQNPFVWTRPRSGNPTIPTVPYREREIGVLALHHPWFRVYALPNRVFAIHEPYHAQGVLSYLILGESRALLFDTGMGISSMKAVAEQLTEKPLVVVNSHTHFDHIGCNWEFGGAFAFDCIQSRTALAAGLSHEMMLPELTSEQFYAPYPPLFDPETFSVLPCGLNPLKDGDKIELGQRTLEVLYMPGHSTDSIMLIDRLNRLLFTGDTYYPGRLFVIAGHADFSVYCGTMEKLRELAGQIDVLHPSHNLPQDDPANLHKAANAFALLQDNRAGAGRIARDLPAGCRVYDFDRCSIVRKEEAE